MLGVEAEYGVPVAPSRVEIGNVDREKLRLGEVLQNGFQRAVHTSVRAARPRPFRLFGQPLRVLRRHSHDTDEGATRRPRLPAAPRSWRREMTVPESVQQARQAMIHKVKEKLAGEFFTHAAIFARTPLRWGEPPGSGIEFLQGSGTLVQVDTEDGETRFGVLTCGHVLAAFDECSDGARDNSLTLLVPNHGPRAESPPWSGTMPYPRATAVIEGGGCEEATMPDLAWWPLTPEEVQGLTDRRGSGAKFYNLNKGLQKYGAWKQRLKAAGGMSENEMLSNNIFMAVGWNQQIHGRTRGRRGGSG